MTDGVDTFMASMVAHAQPVPIERAQALARECYGLQACAAPMTGERDENFRLTTAEGAQYVLKIANPAETALVIELQTAALLHLEKTDPAFPSPRVVRERTGCTQVRFTDDTGLERTARVLTYLSGRLLGSASRSSRQRAACGRMGARLTRALGNFRHPGAKRAVIWDVRHTGHLWQLLEEMPGFPYPAEAASLLNRIVPDIDSQLPRLRQQVVHNDLNPLNIVVDAAHEERVTGVFDFGDITHTTLIGDVAVAAAELIPPDCANPAAAGAAVLDVARAYHESVPLLPPELALLNRLVAARLLMNVVVHEWHVHHNPANRHYAPLDAAFMRERFEIAAGLLREEIRL